MRFRSGVACAFAVALWGTPLAAQSGDPDVERALRETRMRSLLIERLGKDGLSLRVAMVGDKALLKGELGSEQSRSLAEEVALSLPGVNVVDNATTLMRLRKAPATARAGAVEDAALEGRVRDVLLSQIGRNALKIEIAADGGTVTLSGAVPSPTVARDAAAMARSINGVKKVVDNLRPTT